MSLSTLESPASLRALDAATRRQTSEQLAEAAAREEIADAFGLIRTVPPQRIAVPCIEAKGGSVRVRSMSLAEVVRDLTMEGRSEEQLLAVLAGSDCPLVQKLRDALCSEWQRQWAGDIAEARS